MSRISWHHLEASYSLSPNCWCNFCISGGCSVEINQEITQDKITVPSVYISLSQISVGSHLWTKPTWQIYTSYVMERLDFSCFSCSIFVLYCIILFTISSILGKRRERKKSQKSAVIKNIYIWISGRARQEMPHTENTRLLLSPDLDLSTRDICSHRISIISRKPLLNKDPSLYKFLALLKISYPSMSPV